MIEINLLPVDLRKSSPGKGVPAEGILKALSVKPSTVVIWCAAFVLLIESLLVVVLFSRHIQLRILNEKHARLNLGKKEIEKIKGQFGRISSDASSASVEELMEGRFDWAKCLNGISDAIIPGIWLTELQYDERVVEPPGQAASDLKENMLPVVEAGPRGRSRAVKMLILSGYAYGSGSDLTVYISRFVKSLKDNTDFNSEFKGIRIEEINRQNIDVQEAMFFRLACSSEGA